VKILKRWLEICLRIGVNSPSIGESMSEEKNGVEKPVTELLPPVPITVVSSASNIPAEVVTPANQPNIRLNVIAPAVAIFVRFLHSFFTALVGLVIAGLTPEGGRLLYTSDFYHLVVTCASLAIPAAGVGLLKDLVTVFGRLEGKYPLFSGSV
jgi:hypothetical protein